MTVSVAVWSIFSFFFFFYLTRQIINGLLFLDWVFVLVSLVFIIGRSCSANVTVVIG